MSEPLLCFGRMPPGPGCVVSPACEAVCRERTLSDVLAKVETRLKELEAGARRHQERYPGRYTFEDGVQAAVQAIRHVLDPGWRLR